MIDAATPEVFRGIVDEYDAEEQPNATPAIPSGSRNGWSKLDVPAWLAARGVRFTEKRESDRTVYAIDCPFDAQHKGEANVTQFASGAVHASCFHNSCQGHDWAAFRDAIGKPDVDHYDPPLHRKPQTPTASATTPRPPAKILRIGELYSENPALKEPLIDQLCRLGEVVNLISKSKAGKSWTVYGLIFSVVMGWKWLGRFQCTPGRVLLIDNELHPETLSFRLKMVADQLGLRPEDYADKIDVMPLRGNLCNIMERDLLFAGVSPGDYSLIVIDALYRMFPGDGMSENDNAAMAAVYNAVDQYAGLLGCAFLLVHHASKGDQSGKDVTDVGSGAGAQSRAADTHLVMRPHQEDGCVVLDAAVRSFKPLEPVVLRWTFPLWTAADDLDPAAMRCAPTRGDERQEARDRDGCEAIVKGLRSKGACTARWLREFTGFGKDRVNRLLRLMVDDERLTVTEVDVAGNQCDEYHLAPHLQPSDWGGGLGGRGVGGPPDVPPDHVGGGGRYESPIGDVIPPDHPTPSPEQQTTGKRRPRSKSNSRRKPHGKAKAASE